ncbi:RHS repeat-associated core domain-containing protein [Erwinia sp. BNK-24-b]|uniref:RHS repeat-associated core domain-containing protein n=1 Tax=Erwinia TaxID=551 RepID=UPI0039BF50AA|nr:hypothetical protein [Erwinia phyllosphaerae]
MYHLFRYYGPVAGRFIEIDQIGLADKVNTYSYVGDRLTWGGLVARQVRKH